MIQSEKLKEHARRLRLYNIANRMDSILHHAQEEKPTYPEFLSLVLGTEVEMKEKKLRIEDALAATKAAVEEGIVAGGGTALINAMPAVKKLVDKLSGDEKTGAQIVYKALEEPVRQIAVNAGLEGSVICDNVKKANKVGYGFNALTEEYTDMVSAGIVDPTKVTRSALQNASSVAAMVLTTESLVTDIKEPAAPAAPAVCPGSSAPSG